MENFGCFGTSDLKYGNELKSNEEQTTEGDRTQFSHLPDSKSYIRKLESKLLKVKGCTKEVSSKEMISIMQNARDDHMNHFISFSSDNSPFMFDGSEKKVSASFIERKLFPEKNGVTYEELQYLLTSDVLEKTSMEEDIKTTNESIVER